MIKELRELRPQLSTEELASLVRQLFSFARQLYLHTTAERNDYSSVKRLIYPKNNYELNQKPQYLELLSLSERLRICWDDWQWHLSNRIHLRKESPEQEIELLLSVIEGNGFSEAAIRRVVKDGYLDSDYKGNLEYRYYDFSLLPLNLLLGRSVLSYFIPPSDYFQPHSSKKADPYGLLWATSRATTAIGQSAAVISSDDNRLLGTHKFPHTLLMNIDFYCPIGCSDCYKTRFGTREYTKPRNRSTKSASIYYHPDRGMINPPTSGEVLEQARRVVNWMNNDPRGKSVYDVIISGGEPFILTDEKLSSILREMEKASNLQILRFCTGTIFLGLPMRITENLANLLEEFSLRTGVRVTVQAHLACHEQIVAESYFAVTRLRKRGVTVYSQIPIKEGINFFLGNPERTLDSLATLCRKQATIGVEPYMLIVDMHPSTNDFYVPLEPLLAAWGDLVESHNFPGLERPRTLSILFEHGNIVLSGNTLLSMKKTIDRHTNIVTYSIPRIGQSKMGRPAIAEIFDYQEPLGPYNDDPDSLRKLFRDFIAPK